MAKCRVSFEYIEVDGSVRQDKMTIPLSPQSNHVQVKLSDGTTRDELDGPWVVKGEPFEGELTDEEIVLLKSRPGTFFSAAWRFQVEEVN